MSNEPIKAEQAEPEITFAKTLGLFDATMIGVGAMIGAGIFVLTGIACGEAGPAALLAFALNGAVTLITAMAYAELASSIPQAGGGYAYVKNAFPDVLGFVAGCWLWFAYTVACSLYAAGFGSFFLEFLARYFPGTYGILVGLVGEHLATVGMILMAGVSFTLLNVRGAGVTGKAENVMVVAKIAVLAVFIIFGIEAIVEDAPAAKAEFTPFLPKGLSGVVIAMGLTFIAFEGYDLIATMAEEIRDPEKNIPKATFISLGVTVFIYMCVLIVSLGAVHVDGMRSWEFLGKYQEIAIVKAAAKMMPGVGVFLIVFGGVLSTISALNATVLASSRVAFSMARDRWLPEVLAGIHKTRQTPHVAIFVTGAIFLIVAVTLPVNALGSAASVMFLLVFAMVNLALVALRRKQPGLSRPFRIPLYPVLPLVGFVINLALAIYQVVFDPRPWGVVVAWTVLGLLFYYAVFDKKRRALGPQVLELERSPLAAEKKRYRILVTLANPETVVPLINIAAALAKQKDGEIVALTVTLVPEQLPINEGLRIAHHRRPRLRKALERAKELDVPCSVDLRVAHKLADAIHSAVVNQKADLLVMGWKGYTRKRDRIFGELTDHMVRHCPCDLALVKVVQGPTKRILLATAGGPNATLGADFIRGVATLYDAEAEACVVVPQGAETAAKQEARKRITGSLAELDPEGRLGCRLIQSDSIATGIVKTSKEYDLVVIGAAPSKPFRQILVGDIPAKVARFSPRSVVLVRRWQGPMSGIFRKLFG